MVFAKLDELLISEPTKLTGHRAAVDGEVVGELLAVEGNVEGGVPLVPRLTREIGEQLLARGTLGQMFQFPTELEIALCQNGEKISGQLVVKRAGVCAECHHFRHVQKKDFCGGPCPDGHFQWLIGPDGVGFPENITGETSGDEVGVAPEVLLHNIDRTGENQSEAISVVAAVVNKAILGVAYFFARRQSSSGKISSDAIPAKTGQSCRMFSYAHRFIVSAHLSFFVGKQQKYMRYCMMDWGKSQEVERGDAVGVRRRIKRRSGCGELFQESLPRTEKFPILDIKPLVCGILPKNHVCQVKGE